MLATNQMYNQKRGNHAKQPRMQNNQKRGYNDCSRSKQPKEAFMTAAKRGYYDSSHINQGGQNV